MEKEEDIDIHEKVFPISKCNKYSLKINLYDEKINIILEEKNMFDSRIGINLNQDLNV